MVKNSGVSHLSNQPASDNSPNNDGKYLKGDGKGCDLLWPQSAVHIDSDGGGTQAGVNMVLCQGGDYL